MAKLMWDTAGDRVFETGVDHAVLYILDETGEYAVGVPWNGLTSVSESPSGAETTPQYADNIKYLNLVSAEEFGATIEAFTYPDEFGQFDGTATPYAGVLLGQQTRKMFGLSYRTLVGNDLEGTEHGYKLHLIYGCRAAPSEKAYGTVNDTPEAITFSWEITTIPAAVADVNGKSYRPVASITLDSTKIDAQGMADIEEMLYGGASTEAMLPMPNDVIETIGLSVSTGG